MPSACYLPLAATRRFSPLVLDYLAGKDALQGLTAFAPDAAGLAQAIEARKAYPVDRSMLAAVLEEQYRNLPHTEKALAAIDALRQESTFTVCTAHQPNLATGYLYFIYKILHAVKLAEELKKAHPAYAFVPVYYMGSEDADLEELGTFRFGDRKFVWDAAGQTGAVGRMRTASLAPLLHELFALIGPPGDRAKELEFLLREAYLKHDTIAAATRYLVHTLFGKYGLLVLDPDDARLKQSFVPVMEEDLLEHTAGRLVNDTIEQLQQAGYKAQAHPRSINLFYLRDNIRERIERDGDRWRVLGTDISWNEAGLRQELGTHPGRFSPNVMLRPLYQETILPNVAFIGGGAEVAYWLQLRSLFEHHSVFYPAMLLRQSIMWVSKAQKALLDKTGLSYEALFLSKDEAAKAYVSLHQQWQLPTAHTALEALLSNLRSKATTIDPTLERSADATLARMKHLVTGLEQKMLRAIKRKEATGLSRIERLQSALLPGGGLAERKENFMPYFLEYGPGYFDTLLQYIEPLGARFLIAEGD